MRLTGKIHDILNQIQLLITIYGDATFAEIQQTMETTQKTSPMT